MPAAVRQGLQLKVAKKAAKKGLSAGNLPALKLSSQSFYRSRKIDVLSSVKNYLLEERFEVKHKAEEPLAESNIIFLLDTSGSMAAMQQMSYLKGVMERTVNNRRYKKVSFALIMLDGEDAVILQPFTHNHQLISRQAGGLRTKGKTNLGAAFKKVHELSRGVDKSSLQLFTFTDGKANTGTAEHTPFEWALHSYRKYVGKGIKSTIIDTERGVVRLGKAKELADKLGVKYAEISF